jgi:hypothetical protein
MTLPTSVLGVQVCESCERNHATIASLSRNTFGRLLLAVYDLYFAQQFIASRESFMIAKALSCEYVTVLPFLNVTSMLVFLPSSDWRTTKRFDVRVF